MQLTKQNTVRPKRRVPQRRRSNHRIRLCGHSIRGIYCTKKQSRHIATRCRGRGGRPVRHGDTLQLPKINGKQLRKLSNVESHIKILSNNRFETYLVKDCKLKKHELSQICDKCNIPYDESESASELALKIKSAYNRATQEESYLIGFLLTAIICGVCGTFITYLVWTLLLLLLPFAALSVIVTGPFGFGILAFLYIVLILVKMGVTNQETLGYMCRFYGVRSALAGGVIYLLYMLFKHYGKSKAAKKIIAQIQEQYDNEQKSN